jgi:hypothetical protein
VAGRGSATAGGPGSVRLAGASRPGLSPHRGEPGGAGHEPRHRAQRQPRGDPRRDHHRQLRTPLRARTGIAPAGLRGGGAQRPRPAPGGVRGAGGAAGLTTAGAGYSISVGTWRCRSGPACTRSARC